MLGTHFFHQNVLFLLTSTPLKMNYPGAELRGIKMNFYLINPDAEHRGILLIKSKSFFCPLFNLSFHVSSIMFTEIYK